MTSENRIHRTFSKTLHDPTGVHKFAVTLASQEFVQPPIYLPKPASDAVLNKFVEEDRRIYPALNAFQPAQIARLNNYLHRPRKTRSLTLEGVPLRHPTNYSRAGKVWLVGTGMAQIELQFVFGLQALCIDCGNGTDGLTGRFISLIIPILLLHTDQGGPGQFC